MAAVATPSSATVTSKIGPAQTVTALAVADVREVKFMLFGPNNATCQIMKTNGVVQTYDIAVTATVTATISSGVLAITLNQ